MNCHQKIVFNGKSVVLLCATLIASGIMLVPSRSLALVQNPNVTLTSGGSVATLNLGGGSGNIGMNSWSVLGQNQLNQQWFWYSIGSGQVAQSIDTIGSTYGVTINQPNSSQVDVIYGTALNAPLSIEVDYTLNGGGVGSGNADLMENIYADNYSGSGITLNLYEYSNFNLLQSGNNNVVIIPNPSGPGYEASYQASGGTAIEETLVSPFANNAEAEPVGGASDTLNSITTIAGYSLNNNLTASGNVSFAFQWTANIASGGELQIVKDKELSVQAVPEPSSVAFIALGVGALGLVLRRKLA